jgi:uncharacterized protein (DUF1778 family)
MATHVATKTATKSVPLRLTEDEHAALRLIASAEDRTLTSVIIRALREKYPDFARVSS